MLGPALGLTRIFYHFKLYISVASGDFFNRVSNLFTNVSERTGGMSRVQSKAVARYSQ